MSLNQFTDRNYKKSTVWCANDFNAKKTVMACGAKDTRYWITSLVSREQRVQMVLSKS